MFAMSLKLDFFSLANACASPKITGPCECVEGDKYAKLIPLLESIHNVDWPFQFFHTESRCRINYKLEGINRLYLDVYVLPLANTNLESKKFMCVVDLHYVSSSQHTLECITKEAKIQDLTVLMIQTNHVLVIELVVRALIHVAFDFKSTFGKC